MYMYCKNLSLALIYKIWTPILIIHFVDSPTCELVLVKIAKHNFMEKGVKWYEKCAVIKYAHISATNVTYNSITA